MKKSVKRHNKELLEKAEQAQLERRKTAREVLRRMVAPPDTDDWENIQIVRKKPQDLRWKVLLEAKWGKGQKKEREE